MVRASILCPPQIRLFNSETEQRPAGDPRVPRFFKDKLAIFGVPADVTEEQLVEKLKDHGLTGTLNYKSAAETQDARGGVCFLTVSSAEAGEKLKEEVYPEGIPIGEHKLELNYLRNKFFAKWTRTVYLGNLNWNAEEWHIEEFLQDCGEILEIRIGR